jgi:hypothetical protein
LQTVEETLFANRKTKEKNASSNYPNTPLRIKIMWHTSWMEID